MSTLSGKTLYEKESPKTQSIEAVKTLLSWRKMPTSPMPDYIEMPGGVFLIANNKKDAYYTTTARDCSCPARTYNPGNPCKHMRARFGIKPAQVQEDSIRPTAKWDGGHNGPVSEVA